MPRIGRRTFLKLGAAGVAGLAVPWNWAPTQVARASVQIPQTALSGKSIPRFIEPLPVFGSKDGLETGETYAPRVTGTSITVTMNEVQQKVLPATFYSALPGPFNAGTYVWAYNVGNTIPLYPGVTIEAQRGKSTTVTYVNNLLSTSDGGWVQKYITVDQTIHWADPLMQMGSRDPYMGPPPAVAHLHGAEVSSSYDGGPDQWFTPNGIHGLGYETFQACQPNAAVYRYPNGQEATTLWFHDHALGATRLNVYAGLAAFYLLRDEYDTGKPDNPLRLPAGPYEREIVIQDRQFDTNGQWYFPDSGSSDDLNGPPPNPEVHPYWNPEFFGDVMVVNGKSWPYFNVEPRRYRFRLLDGCNARFLELRLENRAAEKPGPGFWVIGSGGGLLDSPVMLNDPKVPGGKTQRLLMAPGERYDVIIDFAGYAGQTLTLINSAKAPYPNGMTVDPQTTGQVMQFRVTLPTSKDSTYNPATDGALRGGSKQMPTIVRLADPTKGTAAAGVNPNVTRQLVLVEVEGPGGPVEVLVNNTKWDGLRDGTDTPVSKDAVNDGHGNYLTELPRVGSTEVWEVVNMTGDAHPIHLHLVQFQLMNRQAFNVTQYRKLYDSLFQGGTYPGATTTGWDDVVYPAGVYIPGYGPPLPYDGSDKRSGGKPGGNPDVTPFLRHGTRAPGPEEAGWKDTVKMYPGDVTRIVVRFAPQDVAAKDASAGTNLYPFDPAVGPGYVWHCHIVDHEDNEMMRPYRPVP